MQDRGRHEDNLTLRAAEGVASVSARDWDACAGAESISERNAANPLPHRQEPGPDALERNPESSREAVDSKSQETAPNPFLSHAFLSSLEDSRCVGPRSGWTPLPLLVENADGDLLACAPAYAKSHSQGEYVFDHGWAEAYERAGGRYYPKVQVAVPFTPVTGPRLLVRPGAQAPTSRRLLGEGLKALAAQLDASSVHVTFPNEDEARTLAAEGWLLRIGEQFHFKNEGYGDYEDFLATLASRKRKALKRERREALAGGVEVEWLTGRAITEAHWDAFFAFYMDTGSRKWGRPYLNRPFFSMLGERLGERVLLVMARRGGRYVAGALNMIGADALYGRYWGASEATPFLHFELCYHQAIDYALAHGLARVEAGAQGEHKLARGYRPVATYSAHFVRDPGLRRAVADYLARERAQMQAIIADDDEATPFRKGAPPTPA